MAQDQSKEQEQQLTSLQQDLVQALAALKSEQTANVELNGPKRIAKPIGYFAKCGGSI